MPSSLLAFLYLQQSFLLVAWESLLRLDSTKSEYRVFCRLPKTLSGVHAALAFYLLVLVVFLSILVQPLGVSSVS